MDQHVIRGRVGEGFKPVADGLCAGCTAMDDLDTVGRLEKPGIAGVQYQNNRADLGRRQESIKRSIDHTATGQHLPLLGQFPPGPGAAPCGDDDGGCAHGS